MFEKKINLGLIDDIRVFFHSTQRERERKREKGRKEKKGRKKEKNKEKNSNVLIQVIKRVLLCVYVCYSQYLVWRVSTIKYYTHRHKKLLLRPPSLVDPYFADIRLKVPKCACYCYYIAIE